MGLFFGVLFIHLAEKLCVFHRSLAEKLPQLWLKEGCIPLRTNVFPKVSLKLPSNCPKAALNLPQNFLENSFKKPKPALNLP